MTLHDCIHELLTHPNTCVEHGVMIWLETCPLGNVHARVCFFDGPRKGEYMEVIGKHIDHVVDMLHRDVFEALPAPTMRKPV